MASSRTLTTTAVIRGVDALTGPFNAMANKVQGIHQRLHRMSAAVAHAGRSATHGFTTPFALGLAGVIAATQEFAKADLGVRIASIGEHTKDGVTNFAALNEEAEKFQQRVLGISKAKGVNPTELMQAAESIAKMGIPDPEKIDAYIKATASLRQFDPKIGGEEASEFLGTMTILYGKLNKEAAEHNKFVEMAAGNMAVVADATRLSISTLREGAKQYFPLWASMTGPLDGSMEQGFAMLGQMSQAGLNAAESGTAVKSALTKLINPTAQGLAVASRLGLRRADYMEGFGKADPYKAVKQLKATMPQLQGKPGMELFKMMEAARKAGTLGDEKTIARLIKFVGKKAGAKTQADWDEVTGRVQDALTAGGGTIDAFKFLQDLAGKFNSGEASLTDLYALFDPRQVSRLIPILKLMPDIEKLVEQQKEMSGGILDKGQQVYDESSFGKMERALASFQRTMINLRQSPAVAGVIEMLATLGDKFSALPPHLTKAATGLMMLGAAAGPVMWMAGSLGKLLVGASAGLRLFGGAVLAAGVGMAAWAGKMARIAVVIGTLSRLRGVLFGLRALLVGGGPLGLAVAAVSTLAMNFREVWAAAQGFYDGFVSKFAVGSELAQAFTNLGLALNPLLEPFRVMGSAIGKLLGLSDTTTAFAAYFTGGAKAAEGLAKLIDSMATGINSTADGLRRIGEWFEKITPNAETLKKMLPGGHAPGAATPGTMDWAIPQSFEPQQQGQPFSPGDVQAARSAQQGGPAKVELSGAIPLTGQINAKVDINISGPGTGSATVGGKIGTPASAVPVREGNDDGLGN